MHTPYMICGECGWKNGYSNLSVAESNRCVRCGYLGNNWLHEDEEEEPTASPEYTERKGKIMPGTIYFDTLRELAEFLAEFIPNSTAVFIVSKSGGRWVLEFTGGY